MLIEAHYPKWYLNSLVGFKSMTDQMTASAITRLVQRTIRESQRLQAQPQSKSLSGLANGCVR